jgi:RNA-directed DNA polymerase
LSPLLANILLDELDRELERRGLPFVRYADDFVIFTKSLRSARDVTLSVGGGVLQPQACRRKRVNRRSG